MSDPRYRTARWLQMRSAQLTTEPLCKYCQAQGHITAATVADHVTPHRGDDHLFWYGALQSLCRTCHSSVKQAEEAGRTKGCTQAGIPIDPQHHWNAA